MDGMSDASGALQGQVVQKHDVSGPSALDGQSSLLFTCNHQKYINRCDQNRLKILNLHEMNALTII